jgi:cyclopropane fatty-acyl-phospholipid synthase-like methyltransferase
MRSAEVLGRWRFSRDQTVATVRSMSDAFDVVRSSYDRLGTAYRDWSQDTSLRLTMLRRLLDRLSPDSVVVDLGCGPGEPVTRLIAQHHRVIALDASHVQLELARIAAPTAMLVQTDMARCALRSGSVDAVASFYATGHLPARHHESLFASVAEWLRPGGLFLTSVPVFAQETYDPDWLGVPMFFGGIGEAATREAVRQADLVLEFWDTITEDEGDRHTVDFHWLIARKPSAE